MLSAGEGCQGEPDVHKHTYHGAEAGKSDGALTECMGQTYGTLWNLLCVASMRFVVRKIWQPKRQVQKKKTQQQGFPIRSRALKGVRFFRWIQITGTPCISSHSVKCCGMIFGFVCFAGIVLCRICTHCHVPISPARTCAWELCVQDTGAGASQCVTPRGVRQFGGL